MKTMFKHYALFLLLQGATAVEPKASEMEISQIVPSDYVTKNSLKNCKFTSNKNYDVVYCDEGNLVFQNAKGETFGYTLPADIMAQVKTKNGDSVFNFFQSVDSTFADSYMMVGSQVFMLKGKTMTYLASLEALQKAYPTEDLNNILDFQLLNDGKLAWIYLNHSTKGAIFEQFAYDSDDHTFTKGSAPPSVKATNYSLSDPSGPMAYYIDDSDKFLYSLEGTDGGKAYKSEKLELSDICTGAVTNAEDQFSDVVSLGSLLALLQTDQGKITICDTKEKKMVTHMNVPKTATSLFKLASVPLGKNKGGNKLVYSSISNNKQQISEMHFFNNDQVFTFENMYQVEKDAILQISQNGGHSVVQGSDAVGAYVLAQPTQKYVPAKSGGSGGSSRRLETTADSTKPADKTATGTGSDSTKTDDSTKPTVTSSAAKTFDPKPYLSGVAMSLKAIPGYTPASLAECPAGSGVSYSAKTFYQAQECLGCKQLYALGSQDSTAAGQYSKFVASQLCDQAVLDQYMASLSGNKGAGSTGTNDKDQETGSKKTTTTTVAKKTEAKKQTPPKQPAAKNVTLDKDETYWVGVTIVAVAVVVVAALAGTLHCCLRRHDEATREEWKRKQIARNPSRLGDHPSTYLTPGAQAAAPTGGRSSQVKTQTTDYDEEAPQTNRRLLGDGENVHVDVGFGTDSGQPELAVKDGHTREAKTNGEATYELQAVAGAAPQQHSSALAAPVQKISIDEHCDTKQVSFKEACEVEVLEPKVEPWEQKQVEMQSLGAKAQSDIDAGDGEVALGAEGRPKAKTFSGNVRERMETQKEVMRQSAVVQKRKLNQSVIMENESFGEIAGSNHSGEEAGAIATVAKANAGAGASVAIGDGFAVKDATADAGASSNAGGAGGVVLGTGTVVVGIAKAGIVAHVDNEDVSGHTEARTEAHALQPDLIEEEETPVFDRAANVSGGGAVGAAGDEREINADIQRQNPSPRAVRTAMTASDIVPAGQAGAAVGAAAAASVVVDARPLVERPTTLTPDKSQLEPTSMVEPVTPEARVEMNIEGAESAQFGNPSQVTVVARKSEKCNCQAIVYDLATIKDGKCPKCFKTFRRVQIMYTEQSQN